MANRGAANLQESFLNQARRDSLLLSIRLVTGTELKGRIDGFDNFTVILVDNTSRRHMIYKHAIANITMLGTPRRKPVPGKGGQRRPPRPDERPAEAGSSEKAEPKDKPPFNPAMQKLAGLAEASKPQPPAETPAPAPAAAPDLAEPSAPPPLSEDKPSEDKPSDV